jgi:hypothetical protein
MDGAFGLFEEAVIFPQCYTRNHGNSKLLRRTLSVAPQTESLEPIDDAGEVIGRRFEAAARGAQFYLWTETMLYELASDDSVVTGQSLTAT